MPVEVSAPQNMVVFIVTNRPAIRVDESVKVSGLARMLAVIIDVKECDSTIRSMELYHREIIVLLQIDLPPVVRV